MQEDRKQTHLSSKVQIIDKRSLTQQLCEFAIHNLLLPYIFFASVYDFWLALLIPTPFSGGLHLVGEDRLAWKCQAWEPLFPTLPYQFYQMERGCRGYKIQALLHPGKITSVVHFLPHSSPWNQTEVILLCLASSPTYPVFSYFLTCFSWEHFHFKLFAHYFHLRLCFLVKQIETLES